MFVAGPAIIKTSAVPGDTPARSKPAAIGVEAVAQIYIGTEINIIINIAGRPLPYSINILVGINVFIQVANIRPINSQIIKSSIKRVAAY